MNTSHELPSRYSRKVVIIPEPPECHIWIGAIADDGYGRYWHSGIVERVHRYAYRQHHGALDANTVVRHRCDEPLCVNPAHLEAGTRSANRNDSTERGRQGKRRRIEGNYDLRGHYQRSLAIREALRAGWNAEAWRSALSAGRPPGQQRWTFTDQEL